MKPTTVNIKNVLEDEAFMNNLENSKNANPNYSTQEVTIQEAYEGMAEVRNLLIDSLDNGTFEELPFNTRNGIYTNLNNVRRYATNVAQVIPQYNALLSVIHTSRLLDMNSEKEDFDKSVKEINSLRTRYRRLLKDVQEAEKIKNNLDKFKEKVEINLEKISNVSQRADDIDKKFNTDEGNIQSKVDSINEYEQEIENKKKEILAFASNIDDNEEKLNNILDSLSNQIDDELKTKIQTAKDLIIESENALELKQTEGIASAYSSRLKKMADSNIKVYWIIGAVIFVIITLLFGYLLTGGEINVSSIKIGFNPTDNIGFIVGRIALTAIGISGAVFCAKRYVLLRNLEEDYEYKVVLTKSILAFANKIRDLDDTKVAEYLTQVLNELLQDPLRNRKEKGDEKNLLSIENMDKFTDILQKFKRNENF